MSKLKYLTSRGYAPWFAKSPDIQYYVCDKGGGFGSIRNSSTDPCESAGGPVGMDLKYKLALVTGGAKGIGFASANEILNAEARKVIIADLDPCTGIKAACKLNDKHGEGKCCFIPLNVACPQQVEDVLTKVYTTFGSLDVLVNNAGILSTDDADLELDTNLRAVIQATNTALKLMKCQKDGGCILNIGDIKGITGCKFFPVYAAGKSGVHTFSMGLGKETTEFKVRVMALAPGLTETDMGNEFKDKPDPAKLMQRASIAGKGVVYVIESAASGSLWAVEKKKLYKVVWPEKEAMLQIVTGL